MAWLLCLFKKIGSLPNGFDDFPEESGTSQGFPFTGLHIRKKPDPDNQDASDTDDDEDNEDGQDDQDDDDDDEGEDDEGDDEDVPDKGKDGEDPVEVPEANEWELRLIGSRSWEDSERLICIMGAGTDWYF
ncbi:PHOSPHOPANTOTHENOYLCYSTEINE DECARBOXYLASE SUBUNIT VHS3-LIKE ISOFORM X1 [Salix viminalis]|uniref:PHOSPHOPANTOTHENOYLCYSTEINE DECARBOXYLASE SUBUNIT VHS3-LIKE ISOFORM X1 n=1 Tax=Salix viminalis TaxID=40686 RepID=A0A9Q0SED6_SALVM|nr:PHOSPHOPANTOTHENOYLCYSTEINE DECARBOXYLASE SUBUNIT VHS3-LIKE ISOFORM X1 [Salix viminalis]